MAPILTYKLTRFKEAEKYNTSSLEILSYGGNPVAESHIKTLINVFPNARTNLIYGLTEVGLLSNFDVEESNLVCKTKYLSSGRPSACVQIKIVDRKSHIPLEANQRGEICIKSYFEMKGYYKVNSSELFDNDGFIKTGDIGYFDTDGYLYIEHRIKETFKYKAWHIIPSVIEDVLLEHPSIDDAVVIGIPNEEDGEIPAACIVLKEGCSISETEIDRFLVEKVADRDRLRGGVTFVTSLPRTPTGKVIRQDVRNLVLNSL